MTQVNSNLQSASYGILTDLAHWLNREWLSKYLLIYELTRQSFENSPQGSRKQQNLDNKWLEVSRGRYREPPNRLSAKYPSTSHLYAYKWPVPIYYEIWWMLFSLHFPHSTLTVHVYILYVWVCRQVCARECECVCFSLRICDFLCDGTWPL